MGGRPFGAIAAWSVRHAPVVLAFATLIAVGASVAATQVDTDAGLSTLVGKGDPTYQATQRVRAEFGEEPVVVLVKGSLPKLLLGKDLFKLLRLEGCLSGKVPKGAKPFPGACEEIAATKPVQFLAGPATFLNEAVVQIDEQLERLSRRLAPAQFQEYLLTVATRYGITSAPSIDNEEFVATVVFDLAKARGTPKARLAYLFPNSHSAQIVIRLKPDLSEAQRRQAISLIKEAVAETEPRRQCAAEEGGKAEPCFVLQGGEYVVTGAPVVVDGISKALKDALLLLIAVAIVVMAIVLLLAFRSRLRLLPLALALASAALVFGLLDLVGGSLTMASIAVLPILIGLAVDYAIQFQARLDEVQSTGAYGESAARTAANLSGPTIATACLATAAGFLVLLLSPTPMVRGFGILLFGGVLLAFILVMTAGFAALSLRPPGGWRRGGNHPEKASATGGMVGPRGDRTRPLQALVSFAIGRPAPVLIVGVVLAAIGWGVGTQISTVSEVRQLAPRNLGAIEDLNTFEEATGTTGDLEVLVEAPHLTDPATVEWMAGFKRRVLAADDVTAGPALSDFLTRGEGKVTEPDIEATLAALSPYSLEQVAPLDPATGKVGDVALLSFGIRSQTLTEQERLIRSVRAQVGSPPAGVTVRLAGLPVIAAEAGSDLSSSRYWLALAGLGAVALVLLLLLRSFRRALVPLLPTVLATGWASLLIWLTGIPLNPMSAALGALTIAIATEFAVILAGRFEQERSIGADAATALRRAYARTGAAVLASGLTAIAGFAVLVASDIRMLRDFGAVTVIDLAAALLGVIVILPATLTLLERRRAEAVRMKGMANRYSLAVGLIFLALVVVATIHTLTGPGQDVLGLDKQPARWPLPEFAVPVAAGSLEGDANVYQDDCGSSTLPCPESPQRVPACQITTRGAIRVCELFDRPLVLSFWFGTESGCERQQAVVSSVAARYRGRVNFLSLDVRDSRGSVRELVREQGWKMPVGFDRDGAVAALYRVGGCPTFAYAYPGGTLQSASSGDLTVGGLRQHVDELLKATKIAEGGLSMASIEGARIGFGWEPAPTPCWVAPHLEAEFPGLSLATVEVDSRPGRSPEPVRRRLRDLSDRLFGAEAIRLRGRPIPWAYRVFYRQIGLDPDRDRTPVEQLVLDRLQDGGFRSRGMPADALTIATIETGVALRAFDADRLAGGLCIRDAAPGESLPGRAGELASGTLTIADERGPVGLLFGDTGAGYEVDRDSRRVAIAAVGVGAVPTIAVEEALWIAASALEAA